MLRGEMTLAKFWAAEETEEIGIGREEVAGMGAGGLTVVRAGVGGMAALAIDEGRTGMGGRAEAEGGGVMVDVEVVDVEEEGMAAGGFDLGLIGGGINAWTVLELTEDDRWRSKTGERAIDGGFGS